MMVVLSMLDPPLPRPLRSISWAMHCGTRLEPSLIITSQRGQLASLTSPPAGPSAHQCCTSEQQGLWTSSSPLLPSSSLSSTLHPL